MVSIYYDLPVDVQIKIDEIILHDIRGETKTNQRNLRYQLDRVSIGALRYSQVFLGP